MKRLRLRIFGRARRHIDQALDWWAINRPSAPGALEDDLLGGLELIRTQPGAGSRARNVRLAGVRCLYLTRVRYNLYYRLSRDGTTIEVLELWHSSRGSGPNI